MLILSQRHWMIWSLCTVFSSAILIWSLLPISVAPNHNSHPIFQISHLSHGLALLLHYCNTGEREWLVLLWQKSVQTRWVRGSEMGSMLQTIIWQRWYRGSYVTRSLHQTIIYTWIHITYRKWQKRKKREGEKSFGCLCWGQFSDYGVDGDTTVW